MKRGSSIQHARISIDDHTRHLTAWLVALVLIPLTVCFGCRTAGDTAGDLLVNTRALDHYREPNAQIAELGKQFMAAMAPDYPELPAKEREARFEAWLATLQKVDEDAVTALRESFEMELRRSGMTLSKAERDKFFARGLRRRMEKSQKMAEAMEKARKSRKRAFLNGRVVDQDGEPVVGARVKTVAFSWGMTGLIFRRPGPDLRWITRTTDKDGRFKTGKTRGEYISLKNIEKDGYRYIREMQPAWKFYPEHDLKQKPRWFAYEYAMRDEDDVVEFFLWRDVLPFERLVHIEDGTAWKNEVPVGGGPRVYNFLEYTNRKRQRKLTGKPTAMDGDLIFEAVAPAKEGGASALRISAVEGGIVERTEKTFFAPKDGYRDACIVRGRGDFWRSFFVKSRGGKVYTLVTMQFTDARSIGRIRYWASPRGSRNLQPWGPKYASTYFDALRDRDWTSDDTSDLKEDLTLRQREQIAAIEAKLLCQVKEKDVYYRGYLGDNRTHYRFKGEAQKEPYEGLPLIERRLKAVEIARPRFITYCRFPNGKTYYCVMRDDPGEILVFQSMGDIHWKMWKAPSKYVEPSRVNLPRDKKRAKYDRVMIIVPKGPIPKPAKPAATPTPPAQ